MARFHFPLQQLLDLRSRAEDEARCELAETQREVCRQRQRLDHLQQAATLAAQTATPQPGQPVQPGMLLNNDLHLAHLRARTAAQQARVDASSHQEGLHREQLLQAARNREVLERLKEKRLEQYRSASARIENRALDEAGTMVFMRQRENA